MPSSDDGASGDELGTEAVASRTLQEFEKLVADLSRPKFVFRLYVAGGTNRSRLAITNVKNICEQYLPGQYELEVVDVYQQPGATKGAEVIALPTLIKELPLPSRRFVGDMSNTERIVIGLQLRS